MTWCRSEKLYQMPIYSLIGIECFTIQEFLQREEKKLVIWRWKVRWVGWVGQHIPTSSNSFWRGTKLVYDLTLPSWNTTPLRVTNSGHLWLIALFNLSNCWLYTAESIVWFFGKNSKCTSLKSHHTHDLFLVNVFFDYWLRWFIALSPRPLSYDVIVNNPFLVASNHMVQKGIVSSHLKKEWQILKFFAKWISLAYEESNFKLAYESELLHMIMNG